MKTITFSIPVSMPQLTLPSVKSLQNRLGEYFQMAGNAMTQSFNGERSRLSGRNIKRFLKNSPFIPVGIIVVVLIIIVSILFRALSHSNSVVANVSSNTNQNDAVQKPKATQKVNKDFTFALKDETGKEVSKIKYVVQEVMLQDEIIVKGERARAIEGKTFLIINLKITNDFNKSVSINSRDYIRLSVNKSNEKLAPDIHNDPVEVQAISTKYTRVGFPINDSDKNLTLQIGELNGPKEAVKLTIQ